MAGDPFRDAIRAELEAVCTELSISIAVVDTINTDENPDASAPYFELEFPGGSESQYSYGAPGSNLYLEQGQITVRIVVPIGADRDAAEAAASSIRAAFRSLPHSRIALGSHQIRITGTGALGNGLTEGGMWAESIALAYEVYNVG